MEKNTKYFYIGYRYANREPSSEDFGKKYFTSNNYVKNNFDNFDYIIVAEFFDKKDAHKFETQLIKELNCEFLLNTQRIGKHKNPYKKVMVDNTPKVCALPECSKIFTNWRNKCCCTSHSRKYAGRQRHVS
jgi:hypothetical protein